MYPLLTPKQVAEILNCKASTIYAWAKRGFIPAFKLNGAIRFDISEIEDWLKGLRLRTRDIINADAGQASDYIIKKALENRAKKKTL